MSPYIGKTFWEAFILFFSRLFQFLTGDSGSFQMASDELQLLTLMGIAASSGLVGTFLILRKMAMLANSLSHTILVGIILSFILMGMGDGRVNFTILLIASLLTALLTTFLTQCVSHTFKLYEDASNGFVFSLLFALGVVIATIFTRNSHVGTELIMGNVDALHSSDLRLVMYVLIINVFLCILLYRLYWVSTFDKTFSSVIGLPVTLMSYVLMTQVSSAVIGGFRVVGVLMVLSFIVAPPLIARLLTRRLGAMLCLSVCIGCLASLVGVLLSRHLLTKYYLAFSTSGLIVSCLVCFFILAALFSKRKGIVCVGIRRILSRRKLGLEH